MRVLTAAPKRLQILILYETWVVVSFTPLSSSLMMTMMILLGPRATPRNTEEDEDSRHSIEIKAIYLYNINVRASPSFHSLTHSLTNPPTHSLAWLGNLISIAPRRGSSPFSSPSSSSSASSSYPQLADLGIHGTVITITQKPHPPLLCSIIRARQGNGRKGMASQDCSV